MPASARTLGVDAERFNEAELFPRRRCDSIAAEVRGIMVGGSMELGFPLSKEVCRGSRMGSITGSSICSESDAMANSFISPAS